MIKIENHSVPQCARFQHFDQLLNKMEGTKMNSQTILLHGWQSRDKLVEICVIDDCHCDNI